MKKESGWQGLLVFLLLLYGSDNGEDRGLISQVDMISQQQIEEARAFGGDGRAKV